MRIKIEFNKDGHYYVLIVTTVADLICAIVDCIENSELNLTWDDGIILYNGVIKKCQEGIRNA